MNNLKQNSDNELIELIKEENRTSSRAFFELYSRHSSKVKHYLVSLVGSEMANDLYQETWIDFYKSILRNPIEDTASLLFVIAKRKYLAYLEKHKMNFVINVENIDDYYHQFVGDEETQINFPDFKSKLDFIINNYLEPDVKEAFVLRKFYNYEYSEIAKQCECTEEAARQKVSRAVRKVRLLAKQILTV